jgi:hypothetical protein
MGLGIRYSGMVIRDQDWVDCIQFLQPAPPPKKNFGILEVRDNAKEAEKRLETTPA